MGVGGARRLQEKVGGTRAGHARFARPLTEIDPETRRATQAFLDRIDGEYPVIAAILYGSRARGDHEPDSDVDLAIVLEGEAGDRYKVAGEFAGIEFHIMMQTGVLLQSIPLWENEIAHPAKFSNPALIANILREGIRL